MIQNPNYGYAPYQTYQQPMQYAQANPYLERLNGLQQYQQSLQQPQIQQQPQIPMLNGKVVDSLDVVKATDIPMDGKIYYFPKADGTEMYVKHWLANGTTQIVTYKPVVEPTENLPSETEKAESGAINALTGEIMERFNNLESKIDELKKTVAPKTAARTKKESSAE